MDAGLGATTAIASLLGQGETSPMVTFNGEHFLDQRARRPVAHIVNGVDDRAHLAPDRRAARPGRGRGRRAVSRRARARLPLAGLHRRRGRAGPIVAGADGGGPRAFPAPAPHTRPVKLAATAPPASAELVERIGIVQGELEVPAGVMSVLELAFADVGIPVVTLWARVPHYVAGMPFPEASAALVEGLADVAGLASTPPRCATQPTARAARWTNSSPTTTSTRPWCASSRRTSTPPRAMHGRREVPSGDEIAAELEEFLRGEEQ